MDGFSNFKKVKHSEFCQEFNENILCHLDLDVDPKNRSRTSKKGPDPWIWIRIYNTEF
jgi:hypothetical protein